MGVEQECQSPQDLSWMTLGAGGIVQFRDGGELCRYGVGDEGKTGIRGASLQSLKLG